MTQAIIGMLLGIATSFIAGIFLIWKGDQLVHYLRRLPTKWRVAIISKAYLKALHGYPYSYVHLMALVGMATILLLTLIAYVFLCFVAFNVDFSLPPEEINRSLHNLIGPFSLGTNKLFNPWFLLSMALFCAYIFGRIVFVTLPPELLVPYAHRELTRVRECVSKCGTAKQFLEYTDLEHGARSLMDVMHLMGCAKTIFGDIELGLANKILERIPKDIPMQIGDVESRSEES